MPAATSVPEKKAEVVKPDVKVTPSRPNLFAMSPFALMGEFTREMERMFGNGGTSWYPAVECRECDGALEITAELPGLTKNDVKVEIAGDHLVIEGEKRENKEEKKEGYFQSERHYGSFYRTVPLPKGTTEKEIKAELANGVLKVTLPVAKAPAPKQIPVNG